MPPSAAPEWLRVGCSFDTTATRAPASWASIAARMPAQPAPTTSTSNGPSISTEPIGCRRSQAPDRLRPTLREHRRTRSIETPRDRFHIVDLERDPDVPRDSTAHLDLVDVVGVRGIAELERGATRVENRVGAVVTGEGAELLQAEDVTVERERCVVVRRGDDETKLSDAHAGRGPAATTAGSTSAANDASKFERNIAASSAAFSSYALGSAHVPRGSRSALSTPGTEIGTSKPKTGSVRYSTPSSAPERAACRRPRVAVIGMRWPTPNGPPVQPVFTSQTLAPCLSSFSPSSRAYTAGGCGRNGAPKHVENVGWGSVTPSSVPASFAVNPERNQYIACSRESRAIGGSTAKASAARKTTELGCPARFVGRAFAMRSSLYAALVFSVFASSSRSTTPASSTATFSRIVPNVRVVRQICGSASAESLITLA